MTAEPPGVGEDRAARRDAQTLFDRPLVLEAGAGTGKTATLVARVASWCLGPGWERAAAADAGAPEERVAARVLRRVAAITFTEAAAAEMGERVSAVLAAVEAGRATPGFDPEALACPAGQRGRRAAALRAVLDQLRVQTIHAFCRRLLAEHPLEAGLHPHFQVDADESRQKATVREVLEDELGALLAGPDGLRVLARPNQGPPQLEQGLLHLLRRGVPATALADDPLAPERVVALVARLCPPLDAFVSCEAGRLEALGGRAPKLAKTATLLRELAAGLAAGVVDAAELATQLDGLAGSGLDAGYLLEQARKGFGVRGGGALGPDAGELAAEAEHLAPLLGHLQKLDLALLRAVSAVVAPLYAEVWRRLRARGIESFAALLEDARALLAERPAVRRRVRGQLDQLLVDEFQDTDATQCEIVRWLALDGPEAERPGLFLVGDPKQSIYGWRNADLEAYEGFRAAVQAAGGALRRLVVNHRSTPAILDEVRRVIEPVMRPQPGLQPAFEALVPARETEASVPDGLAPVEHWVSWRWDADDGQPARTRASEGERLEAARVAAEVAALGRSGVPWRRIGLLFRAGTALESTLAALRSAGVPFAVEGDRSYFERREIIEAGALVRCILDPHDQLALLTLLRSAVVGVPDAALLPLWAQELPARLASLHGDDPGAEADLRRRIAAAEAQVPDDVPGIARVAGWGDGLLDAALAVGRLRASFEEDPADRFVERLRQLLLLEVTESARYLGAYRLANLDRFFRDLLLALRDGEGDPQAILRGLRQDVADRREAEEGRPVEAVEDAVQVMTIHKAKGLDFEHVYLLQLHKGAGPAPTLQADRIEGSWEFELLGARTLGCDRVEARRQAVEAAERVRTLYVAMTRARRRLVLAGVRPEFAMRAAEGHMALLEARRGQPPPLGAAMAERARAGGPPWLDRADARWVFPALEAPAGPAGAERRRPRLDVAAVEAGSRELERARARAAVRDERPWRAAISQLAHESVRERWRGRGEEDAMPDLSGAIAPEQAAAVGTVVHAVLERIDAGGDLEVERRRAELRLDDDLVRALPEGDREAARARARELLARFFEGPLARRLSDLAPHLLGREVPVLLEPEPGRQDGPVGFLAGAVDLLYRDPGDGAIVIADYKTDRVASEDEIAHRAARYRRQGEGYVRAVERALGLPRPPAFELWFLHAGVVHRVSPLDRSPQRGARDARAADGIREPGGTSG